MKKVSTSTLRQWVDGSVDMKKRIPIEIEHDTTKIVFNVRTSLSLSEITTFINRVISGCFDERGEYHDEYFKPMFEATVIQMMTDLPVLGVKGAANELDVDAMSAVYSLSKIQNIRDEELQDTISKLMTCCENTISWKKDVAVASLQSNAVTALVNDVKNLVNTLLQKVNETDVNAMIRYAGELSEKTSKLEPNELANGIIEFASGKRNDD